MFACMYVCIYVSIYKPSAISKICPGPYKIRIYKGLKKFTPPKSF